MGKSKRFGLLSIVLVALSLGLIFVKGFNYGIDFAGGTLIQVKYEGEKAPIADVRKVIEKEKSYEGATVTFFGSDDEIVIRTKMSSKAVGKDVGDEVRTLLKETGSFETRKIPAVTITIAGNMRRFCTKEKAKIRTVRPTSLSLGSQRCSGESRYTYSSIPKFMREPVVQV